MHTPHMRVDTWHQSCMLNVNHASISVRSSCLWTPRHTESSSGHVAPRRAWSENKGGPTNRRKSGNVKMWPHTGWEQQKWAADDAPPETSSTSSGTWQDCIANAEPHHPEMWAHPDGAHIDNAIEAPPNKPSDRETDFRPV